MVGGIGTKHYSELVNVPLIKENRRELPSSPSYLEMPAGGELVVGGIGTKHYSGELVYVPRTCSGLVQRPSCSKIRF